MKILLVILLLPLNLFAKDIPTPRNGTVYDTERNSVIKYECENLKLHDEQILKDRIECNIEQIIITKPNFLLEEERKKLEKEVLDPVLEAIETGGISDEDLEKPLNKFTNEELEKLGILYVTEVKDKELCALIEDEDNIAWASKRKTKNDLKIWLEYAENYCNVMSLSINQFVQFSTGFELHQFDESNRTCRVNLVTFKMKYRASEQWFPDTKEEDILYHWIAIPKEISDVVFLDRFEQRNSGSFPDWNYIQKRVINRQKNSYLFSLPYFSEKEYVYGLLREKTLQECDYFSYDMGWDVYE